jgi:hypothetical protein
MCCSICTAISSSTQRARGGRLRRSNFRKHWYRSI